MADLSPAVRAFLDEVRFAVLATVNPDGTAQQTVMWYLLDGDDIVMNTRRGRKKDRNLLRDGRVSICVEDGQRYVSLSGSVTLDDNQDTAHADIRRLAIRYEGPEQGEAVARDGFKGQERVSIRMTIDQIDFHTD